MVKLRAAQSFSVSFSTICPHGVFACSAGSPWPSPASVALFRCCIKSHLALMPAHSDWPWTILLAIFLHLTPTHRDAFKSERLTASFSWYVSTTKNSAAEVHSIQVMQYKQRMCTPLHPPQHRTAAWILCAITVERHTEVHRHHGGSNHLNRGPQPSLEPRARLLKTSPN